jgi:hypothetical protein
MEKLILTNQQVEEAVHALTHFNPECSMKTKMTLARNLRKLSSARTDKEHARIKLVNSIVQDKTRKPEPGEQNIRLSAGEQELLAPRYKELMETKVEVEIHPIEIYDSAAGMKPADPAHALDISKSPFPNELIAALIDVVLFEK